jgi:hypothetical protein
VSYTTVGSTASAAFACAERAHGHADPLHGRGVHTEAGGDLPYAFCAFLKSLTDSTLGSGIHEIIRMMLEVQNGTGTAGTDLLVVNDTAHTARAW